jgi:hypothetical protein
MTCPPAWRDSLDQEAKALKRMCESKDARMLTLEGAAYQVKK